jgi:hypothetical protein
MAAEACLGRRTHTTAMRRKSRKEREKPREARDIDSLIISPT